MYILTELKMEYNKLKKLTDNKVNLRNIEFKIRQFELLEKLKIIENGKHENK
jgi:hypothetical protein